MSTVIKQKGSVVKVTTPVITPEKKERMKKLAEQFFANKKNFQYEHSFLYSGMTAAAVAASHGSFDFAMVLEHFDEMVSAIEFYDKEKSNALDWRDVLIYSTAYLFFDCPLLKKGDLGERIKGLYFLDRGVFGSPRAVNSTHSPKSRKGRFLPKEELSEALQRCIQENDADALCKVVDAQGADIARKAAYALLAAENWPLFEALYHHIDLLPLLDMEMVYEFWCKKLVHDADLRENKYDMKSHEAFLKQWEDLENYPLHKMILDWDTTGRIVPVFFETGFLTPKIMAILLKNGCSFDKPLAPYAGWENLTFHAFAETYGCLAKYMPESLKSRVDCNDASILLNLPAAAQFNEYMLAHPRYGKSVQMSAAKPAKTPKSKGLTEAQKRRIAQDEHEGVEFGNNYRMLKTYGCENEAETYEVPDMITAIGVEAFVDCSDNLKQVILPEGLTRIGRMAFAWTEISKINFPESLTSIGEGAFVCCHELKSVRIPDGVTELPFDAFGHCEQLQSVELPEGIQLHPESFRDCPKIKIIYRPHLKQTR